MNACMYSGCLLEGIYMNLCKRKYVWSQSARKIRSHTHTLAKLSAMAAG